MDPITVQATMQDGTIITDIAHTLSELHWLVSAYRRDPDCIEVVYWQEPDPPTPPAVALALGGAAR